MDGMVCVDGQKLDTEAFDRFEATSWNQRSEAYERFFLAFTRRAIPTLLDAAGVQSGTRVLDIGSGPGDVAAACAERGAAVVGIDAAPEMVALAGRRYPGISFAQGDAHQLTHPDASRDAVVGNFVILHVSRPERVAAEAARVLVPGGRFALSTWDVASECRFIGVLTDAVAEVGALPPADLPTGPPFFRFADEGEFSRLLTDAGFTGVKIDTVAFRHHAATVAELWDGMIGATVRTRALILGQSADVQERIRSVFRRLTAEYGTADGVDIPVSMKIASGARA